MNQISIQIGLEIPQINDDLRVQVAKTNQAMTELKSLVECLPLLQVIICEKQPDPPGDDIPAKADDIKKKAAEIGVTIKGPFIMEITELAQGDEEEFDVVTSWANDILLKLKKADSRALGKKVFWLINFGKSKSSKEVMEGIQSLGLNSPEMLYGLDFAKTYPDIQRQKVWISMGEKDKPVHDSDGDRLVLNFRSDGSRRRLDAGYWDGGWYVYHWFLASE